MHSTRFAFGEFQRRCAESRELLATMTALAKSMHRLAQESQKTLGESREFLKRLGDGERIHSGADAAPRNEGIPLRRRIKRTVCSAWVC